MKSWVNEKCGIEIMMLHSLLENDSREQNSTETLQKILKLTRGLLLNYKG